MAVFDICALAKEKIVIAAHRGTSGGNIPCNTLTAYEIAVRQGADLIEIDVSRTKDGKLVIFHPGKEFAHLNHKISIPTLTYQEVLDTIRYVNFDRDATEYSLCTLDEVFETFKGRCFINVDKFWDHPEAIVDAIRRHGMRDQIICKTSHDPRMYDLMEQYAPEIQYLPIIRSDCAHEELLRRNIRYVGAEVLFTTEDSPLCQPEYIEKMHKAGKVVWVNSIVYNYKDVLAAHHSDDTAMRGDMEKGWGWLADRGFDIIQTDWTLPLRMYLEETHRLYRKK